MATDYMTTGKRHPTRRQMRTVCDEIGPDDGVDPRELARARLRQHRDLGASAGRPSSGPSRKARQLGRQVAQTLDGVFAGDVGDDLLRNLRVVSVVPADAGRLIVTVEPMQPLERLDPAELVARLERASGWLRTEVAASVTRRRTPLLSFRLIVPAPHG
jgi:ribosome-binding factor A